MAIVKPPHASSPPFPILNGTRYDCPLTPLLFALASVVHHHPDISRVLVCNLMFIISLYVNDILLKLRNPLISLPNLHKTKFDAPSGYKMNTTKTEALPINMCQSVLA